MLESYNFGDLNLREEVVIEYGRECDEGGCVVVVDRITLFIENYAVQMPAGLYSHLYKIACEFAQELDPYDL